MVKILQINSASGFGGGERHLLDLAFCLQTRGHRVFAAIRPNAVWRERIAFVGDQNILRLPLGNALDWRSARELANFIRERGVEIVHAHLARDYPLAALAIRLSRTNAKLVLTRHVLFPLNRLHKIVLPKETNFIAVSKAVRESLSRQNIAAEKSLHLIYNGVDTRHISSVRRSLNRAVFLEKINLSPARRYVGILGEITAHKGQTDFVRAAKIVAAKFADVDFLIIGKDSSRDKKFQTELEELIAESNLTERVFLLGWREDAASMLGALNVFVSASRVEPFGLAIVEAMAAGLPIAATASEGAREIIIDNETGKLAAIGSAEEIAAAVEYFLLHREAANAFGKRAQTAARERFDLSQMVAQTEKLYQSILNIK